MFRLMSRRVAVGVACAALMVAGWTWWQCARFKHLAVHQPGRVYRSAWLDPQPLKEVIERYQIRAVVNLCEPGEMGADRIIGEREAVTSSGARLIELTMPTAIAPNHPAIAKHLEVMSDPNNYPMLVHCQHGVTRTAKFLTIYDIAFRGVTADQSLAAQPKFGREDHNVHVKAFVREFELQHLRLYPEATASKLDVLRH
jgi:hypothetical protein